MSVKGQLREKPECYSPSRLKTPIEIAENCCSDCADFDTCHLPPSFPSAEQILDLADNIGLVYKDICGGIYSPYVEDTDIRDIVVSFAAKLLNKYGNLP